MKLKFSGIIEYESEITAPDGITSKKIDTIKLDGVEIDFTDASPDDIINQFRNGNQN